MSTLLKAAVEAAQAAGEIQRRFYGKTLKVEMKKDNNLNLVTQVDKACEKKIQSILYKRFPALIFGEKKAARAPGIQNSLGWSIPWMARPTSPIPTPSFASPSLWSRTANRYWGWSMTP